eukprot:TRINITY_DN20834_c0_g1_i1.p2 TRINITY_DN20834_c0_g1~~TRINITY_DN20834_c0_g1_i1.p2  ORF type:complete len:162 (+),score=61.87 TRINITY_DN20834_c0_g1_i1:73-558(+)
MAEQRAIDELVSRGYRLIPQKNTRYIRANDLTMRILYDEKAGRGAAVARFGNDTEGPPDVVHGGALFSVADHLLAFLTNETQKCRTFTANQGVNYRNPAPLGAVVVFEAWVEKVEERPRMRKLSVAFTSALESGKTCVEGTGLWIAKPSIPADLGVHKSKL